MRQRRVVLWKSIVQLGKIYTHLPHFIESCASLMKPTTNMWSISIGNKKMIENKIEWAEKKNKSIRKMYISTLISCLNFLLSLERWSVPCHSVGGAEGVCCLWEPPSLEGTSPQGIFPPHIRWWVNLLTYISSSLTWCRNFYKWQPRIYVLRPVSLGTTMNENVEELY